MVLKRLGRELGFGKGKKFDEKVEEAQKRQEQTAPTSSVPPSPPTEQPATPSLEATTEQPSPVNEEQVPQAEQSEAVVATVGPETYVVQSGDTLSAIAERHYGDANAYMRIFEANRDKLENPDMIHPGQELVIPR